MATVTPNSTYFKTGPGKIYLAPIGTTVPTFTALASVFVAPTWTDWIAVGSTKEGCEMSFGIETEDIDVAESFYPVRTVATKQTAKVSVELAEVNKRNLRFCMNGGTYATAGATTTMVQTYSPPLVGAETRCMFAWESNDDDEIAVFYKVLNSGEVKINRKKGAAHATFPLEFMAELPASGVALVPFNLFYAGETLGTALLS